MKISLVINVDWFLLSHFRQYVLTLVQDGHRVTVYSADTGCGREIENLGAEYVPIKLSRGKSPWLSEIFAVYELYNLTRNLNSDVIECFTIKPIVIVGLLNLIFRLKLRVVLYIPGFGSFVNQIGPVGFLKRLVSLNLYGLISQRENVAFIVENKIAKDLLKSKASRKKSRINLLPGTGVNLDLFKPKGDFEAGQTLTVLMVSRLLKDKGIAVLDEAAGILKRLQPHLKFVVVGDIDNTNPSSFLWSELDNFENLSFWGKQSNVHVIMRNADIFVHPSFHEGFSRVLMEASAAGLPIVTTDVEGCNDAVINNVTGLLVPPRDPIALADALRRYINDPNLRKDLGCNARLHAERNFSETKLSSRHMQIIVNNHE